MQNKITKNYTGEALATPTPKIGLAAYLASPELIESVNLALYLQRPLLLTGEPGIGKTRLAESVTYEFHKDNYQKYLFKWDIKSTSKVQDGIYSFDNLKRLLDVQLCSKEIVTQTIDEPEVPNTQKNIQKLQKEALENIQDSTKYRTFGPLGNAYKNSTAENPCILLIDEIDKAPIDFPNDLLRELDDKKTFTIPETGEEITAQPLLIIITSNREDNLPPAFLRRCIYQHIAFPDDKRLKDILAKHQEIDKELIKNGVAVFSAFRHKQKNNKAEGEKFASTSELIDWLKYLSYIAQNQSSKLEILSQLEKGEMPYSQTLIKNKGEI